MNLLTYLCQNGKMNTYILCGRTTIERMYMKMKRRFIMEFIVIIPLLIAKLTDICPVHGVIIIILMLRRRITPSKLRMTRWQL